MLGAGVRFQLPLGALVVVDAVLAGTITFARGAVVRVLGHVVWVCDGQAAIRMERTGGIPLRVIMDEQRYLRAHFARSD